MCVVCVVRVPQCVIQQRNEIFIALMLRTSNQNTITWPVLQMHGAVKAMLGSQTVYKWQTRPLPLPLPSLMHLAHSPIQTECIMLFPSGVFHVTVTLLLDRCSRLVWLHIQLVISQWEKKRLIGLFVPRKLWTMGVGQEGLIFPRLDPQRLRWCNDALVVSPPGDWWRR